MTLPTRPLTVTINGRRYGPIDVPEGLMMIDVLHEMLGLTGSRLGCGIGICHACVVIWDRDDQTSEEVQTCITGAGFFDGKRIRTIEGIARRNDKAISSRSLRCSRPFSTSSASSAGTARRASSTPPPC
jgi:aerobic-type carbon monoxide dehydrogenase small subunit (CoxS/CutS family)